MNKCSPINLCNRLYIIFQTQSLSLTEPGLGYLYAAKWSPVRPLLYAVCSESGHLLFYDIKKSRTTPILKIAASEKKKPIYSMQFNSHKYVTHRSVQYILLYTCRTQHPTLRQRVVWRDIVVSAHNCWRPATLRVMYRFGSWPVNYVNNSTTSRKCWTK